MKRPDDGEEPNRRAARRDRVLGPASEGPRRGRGPSGERPARSSSRLRRRVATASLFPLSRFGVWETAPARVDCNRTSRVWILWAPMTRRDLPSVDSLGSDDSTRSFVELLISLSSGEENIGRCPSWNCDGRCRSRGGFPKFPADGEIPARAPSHSSRTEGGHVRSPGLALPSDDPADIGRRPRTWSVEGVVTARQHARATRADDDQARRPGDDGRGKIANPFVLDDAICVWRLVRLFEGRNHPAER